MMIWKWVMMSLWTMTMNMNNKFEENGGMVLSIN